jgi:hypothetical protein
MHSALGQRLALDHEPLAAKERFLRCSRAGCPRPIRSDCIDQLARAERSVASAVIVVDGRDAGALRVLVDGAPAPSVLEGRAIEVEPGPHVVRVESARRGVVEETWTAIEGLKLERVTVRFPDALPPTAGSATPPPGRRLTFPVMALGGLSVVAVTSFGIFGLKSISMSDDLHARPAERLTPDDVAALERSLVIADVSLGVFVASFAAAALLYLLQPTHAAQAARR